MLVRVPRSSGTSATTIGVSRTEDSATAKAAAKSPAPESTAPTSTTMPGSAQIDANHEDRLRHRQPGLLCKVGETDMRGAKDETRHRCHLCRAAQEPAAALGETWKDGIVRHLNAR